VAGLGGAAADSGLAALGRDWLVPPLSPAEYDDPAEGGVGRTRGRTAAPGPAVFTEPVRLGAPAGGTTRSPAPTSRRPASPGPMDGGPFLGRGGPRPGLARPGATGKIATNHMIASNRPGDLVRLLLELT